VARDLHAASPDGAAWSVDVGRDVGDAMDDGVPIAVVTATLAPPMGRSPRAFTLVDDVIGRDVPNHVAWIAVRTDFGRGLVAGPASVAGVTGYLRHAVVVDRADGSAARGFGALFRLGAQHIAGGTDHLLFLSALLLAAPLTATRRRWGPPEALGASATKLLRVVTAFTIGHSVTLLASTVGGLVLPSAPVETLVAASILVAAAHAIRPIFPGREAWVAGLFGLCHGLAFASALTDLRLDAAPRVLALLAFNLGIEAMQLAIVAVVTPWLLLLARSGAYTPLRLGGAALAGAAAIGWIGQRALHLANPLDGVVTAITAHPRALLAALVLTAVTARFASYVRPRAAIAPTR
jgi:hypothetical protein